MARINRTDIVQREINDLALSATTDAVANETSDKVVLTYGLNARNSDFCAGTSNTNTGNITITMPTVSASSEVYLTSVNISLAKDVTCDMATGVVTLQLTPFKSGIATDAFKLPVLTLTAQNSILSVSLPYPLRLKANTNMTLTGTFTAGLCSRAATFTGYVVSSN